MAVNTPRILISTAFCGYRRKVSVEYLHVVIWTVTATVFEMEIFEVQINIVAGW